MGPVTWRPSATLNPSFETLRFGRISNAAPFSRPSALKSGLGDRNAELEQEFDDGEEEEEFEDVVEEFEDDVADAYVADGEVAETQADSSVQSHEGDDVARSDGREGPDEQGSGEEGASDDVALSVEYSVTMQAAMGNNSLIYQHELGMNYARVLPDLIVGSCPQTAEDVDTLRDKENVGSILCLQQNSDLEWFGLDLNEIIGRTEERGDIKHIRAEIRDFDPFSLRLALPEAVAKMHKANLERGTAYVHCTAGLGRAPAVALAYMWWMRDFPRLEDANEVLQAVRRCGPKLFAIRAALADILTDCPREPVTVLWRSRGTAPKKVEVAGLDIGWHNRGALERTPNTSWWTLTKELPVGTYYYKFIVDDDKWTYDPDAPLTAPDKDNNVNNYATAQGVTLGPDALLLRKRLMEEGVALTPEERALVVQKINEIAQGL